MDSNSRCKSFTKNGERCRNKRRYGDFCYAHKNKSTKPESNSPSLETTLTSIASFVTILDIAYKHLPTILEWVQALSTVSGRKVQRQRADREVSRIKIPPSKALAAHYCSPLEFGEYAKALQHHLKWTKILKHGSKNFERELEEIPISLRRELLQTSNKVIKSVELFMKELDRHIELIHALSEQLFDLIELASNASPNLVASLASNVADLFENEKPDEWRIDALRKWGEPRKLGILAEHLQTQLAHLGSSPTNIPQGASENKALSLVPRHLREAMLKKCETLLVHIERLEELGVGGDVYARVIITSSLRGIEARLG